MSTPAAHAPFASLRSRLFGVAYRMLGVRADAEDVVQEAWLRWQAVDTACLQSAEACLVTVTTRLAIDRMRRRRTRAETYMGTWLPEPLATGLGPEAHAERSESLALGLLLVLETLSPLERAVFVLGEAFGYEYADIAEIVGRREAAVRQLAHRAREHVRERRPRYTTDPATHRRIADRFLAAAGRGDVQALLDVLAPDVMLIADGGGKVRAPLLPVVGVERVIRFADTARPRSSLSILSALMVLS